MQKMYFQGTESMIFDQPGLNTFRKGGKWASLKLGELVEARIVPADGDLDKSVEHSVLRVHGIVCNQVVVLLRGHAAWNHGVVASGEKDPFHAAAKLFGILEGIYGPLKPDDEFTAVYLEEVQRAS
jgi:hypothetical protein